MPAPTRRAFMGGLLACLASAAALSLPQPAQAACGSQGGPAQRRNGKCQGWKAPNSTRRGSRGGKKGK